MCSVYKQKINNFFCLCMYNEMRNYHVTIIKPFCNLIPICRKVEPDKPLLSLRVNFII